jgi:hypothetical protein
MVVGKIVLAVLLLGLFGFGAYTLCYNLIGYFFQNKPLDLQLYSNMEKVDVIGQTDTPDRSKGIVKKIGQAIHSTIDSASETKFDAEMYYNKLGKIATNFNSIERFLTTIWGYMKPLVSNAFELATGKPLFNVDIIEKEITKATKCLNDSRTQYLDQGHRFTDKDQAVKVIEASNFCKKQIAEKLHVVFPGLAHTITATLILCADTIDAAQLLVYGAQMRPCPVWIHLVGEPGVGKTHIMDSLVNWMYAAIGKGKYAHEIMRYDRKIDNEFWEGYAQNFSVTIDDFLQTTDQAERRSQSLEMIYAVNPNPYHLHFAAMGDKKGRFFDSPFVISTSNYTPGQYLPLNLGVTDAGALYRRMHCKYLVRRNEDFDEIDEKYPDLDEFAKTAMKFSFLEIGDDGNLTATKDITNVMADIFGTYKKHVAHFTRMKNNVSPEALEKVMRLFETGEQNPITDSMEEASEDVEDNGLYLSPMQHENPLGFEKKEIPLISTLDIQKVDVNGQTCSCPGPCPDHYEEKQRAILFRYGQQVLDNYNFSFTGMWELHRVNQLRKSMQMEIEAFDFGVNDHVMRDRQFVEFRDPQGQGDDDDKPWYKKIFSTTQEMDVSSFTVSEDVKSVSGKLFTVNLPTGKAHMMKVLQQGKQFHTDEECYQAIKSEILEAHKKHNCFPTQQSLKLWMDVHCPFFTKRMCEDIFMMPITTTSTQTTTTTITTLTEPVVSSTLATVPLTSFQISYNQAREILRSRVNVPTRIADLYGGQDELYLITAEPMRHMIDKAKQGMSDDKIRAINLAVQTDPTLVYGEIKHEDIGRKTFSISELFWSNNQASASQQILEFLEKGRIMYDYFTKGNVVDEEKFYDCVLFVEDLLTQSIREPVSLEQVNVFVYTYDVRARLKDNGRWKKFTGVSGDYLMYFTKKPDLAYPAILPHYRDQVFGQFADASKRIFKRTDVYVSISL